MGRGNGGGGWRAPRTGRDARGAGAEIVVLTWAQTFGRVARAPKPDAARAAGGPGDGERKSGDDAPGLVVVLGEGKPGS